MKFGLSRNLAARRFGVSIASAVRWVARFHAKGEVSPDTMGGDHRLHHIEAHADYLLGLIRREPDITLAEICDWLIAKSNEAFSTSVLWRFLIGSESLSNRTAHAQERQRADVRERRQQWFDAQLDLAPTKLVFIDETGATKNMERKYGRCRRGRRLRVAIPHSHYKTVALVAGLRLSALVAQKAFDKPMNAVTFEEWVQKCLLPQLSPGDVVIRDNLSSHTGTRVEELIKAAGAELRYLPPSSPDINLIEKAYSKLKAFFSQNRRTDRRRPPPSPRRLRKHFQTRGVRNYFAACRYDTT